MLTDALRDAVSLLLPVECAGCGADGRALCSDCRGALTGDVTQRFTGGLSVHTALRYEGRVRRVMLAFKQQDRTDAAAALAAPLAEAVAVALAAYPGAELALVPTSRSAYRRRGYDPVRLLTRRAGLRVEGVLDHTRRTDTQKTLSLEARATNLAGAFVAKRRLDGRHLVVVDDILTSGATLVEAARAIRAAGGEVTGAATLAFTPRLLPFRDNGRSQG